MRVDVHTHILPRSWPDLSRKYGYGGFLQMEHPPGGCARMMRDGVLFREVEANCWDAGVRLDECDRAAVDIQVLSTVPVLFNYWAKAADCLDWSRFLNDDLAQTVSGHPDRFIGLGTLPMQDSSMAIGELERCREIGLRGVEIGSNINGMNLDAPELFDVFAAASELGMAVFIHPWDMLGAERMSKYWLPWLVGMPAETSLAICSMIFGGVLERLPALRVLFAHGGGAFPATVGRIQHGFDVRPDLCAVDNDRSPRDYLHRFYVDSLVHDPIMLRALIEIMGDDWIALGTDYPFPLGEHQPGSLIDSLETTSEITPEITPEIKDKLLWGNASRWLGVELGQPS